MAIDVIDEKLLEVLQENARISISELSKRINLSLSAVSERVKKLESSGAIRQYTAILDPVIMNQNLISVITVSITGDPKVSEFSKYARSSSSIMSCYRVTGSYDYIATVCSEDQSALQATLDEVKKLRGVSTVHSTVLLEPLKVNFSVPPKAGK
jgi:Lrp/AsnC family leucine-responsive transcriptional regulator